MFIKSGALKAARLRTDLSARNSGEGVSMRLGKLACLVLLLTGSFLSTSNRIEAQVNTVNLSRTVFRSAAPCRKGCQDYAEKYWQTAPSR